MVHRCDHTNPYSRKDAPFCCFALDIEQEICTLDFSGQCVEMLTHATKNLWYHLYSFGSWHFFWKLQFLKTMKFHCAFGIFQHWQKLNFLVQNVFYLWLKIILESGLSDIKSKTNRSVESNEIVLRPRWNIAEQRRILHFIHLGLH